MTDDLKDSDSGAERRFSAFQKIPKNAWYVAAGRDEVTTTPMARQLLGKPVALYRKADGAVVAMHDACPHRGFPLSKSRVVGDTIQCRYHGITFNNRGECIDMPATPAAPRTPAMCVTTYPVVERWHWVWIWMGDPALANPDLIPSFECEDYQHYEHRFYAPLGPIRCNFQLIHDNLCDATHTSFLHEGLLDDPANTEMAHAEPVTERINETTLRVSRTMQNFIPNAEVAGLYHLQADKCYTRRLELWHHLPSLLTAFNRYYQVEDGRETLAVEHITSVGITPASANTAFHLTAVSSSFAQSEQDREGLLYVIGQDIEAFEAIQTYFEAHAATAVEVSVPTDRLGILVRRIIANLVRAETAG